MLIEKNYITLTPAYGHDYASVAQVKEAFNAGKDFVLQDVTSPYFGKVCNVLDFKAGTKVRIRYRKLASVAIIEVPDDRDKAMYLSKEHEKGQTRFNELSN